jgi:lysophospholipase L1-like esterase
MRRIKNSLLVLLSLLLLFLAGEATVRGLQHYEYLPDYSKPPAISAEQQRANKNLIALRPVEDSRLYVEFDPADDRINSYGFRGPEPDIEKTPGVFRIAVIGDSVAFGYGVTREESFPYVLEQSLKAQGIAVEILNFSVSGYGIEAYDALYETKVRQFSPDAVVLSYVLNDILPPQAMFQLIGSAMRQGAQLRQTANTSQFAAWLMTAWGKASGKIMFNVIHRVTYQSDETHQMIRNHLLHIQTMTAADHTPLVVFIFPAFTDFDGYSLQSAHEVIHNELQGLGIPFHDLLGDYISLDAAAVRLTPDDVTHPNAYGHRIAAASVERELKQRNVIPAASTAAK